MGEAAEKNRLARRSIEEEGFGLPRNSSSGTSPKIA